MNNPKNVFNNIFQRMLKKFYNFSHPVVGEILMMHQVSQTRTSDKERYDLEITPTFLEQTILKYKQMGYRFANLDEIYKQMTEHKRSGKKFVCFTFDDGYFNNFTLAYPIFKKYDCPFSIYVCGDKTKTDEIGITSEQIKILADEPLCTIGAHTLTHPHLEILDYTAQNQEIAENKMQLENLINKKVEHFSYPYGSYNAETLEILKKLGFKTAALNLGDKVRKGRPLLQLYRRNIVEA